MDFHGKQTKNKTTTTTLKAEKCCISIEQRMGQCTYLMLKQTPISYFGDTEDKQNGFPRGQAWIKM